MNVLKKYDERIEEFSKEEEYKEPVSKISCFKGIDTLSAMKIHVTVSDFQRFPTAKGFMANLGMLPGELSAEKYSNTPNHQDGECDG
ncbi:MAG: transposase [Thomasclavelia sp.]